MNCSIIIPCFNEALNIETTASHIIDYMSKHFSNMSFELILVDDGSTDITAGKIKVLEQKFAPKVRPHFFPKNIGRGAAIKTGIELSRGEFVTLLDADLSYDVEHLGKIFNSFNNNHKLDVVVISPYMKGGKVSGVPTKRLLISKFANWILAGFFENNLSTVTCVVRGYRGDLIRNLPLFENGKELHLEILRKCAIAGANILEVPGHLAWKESKIRATRKNLKVLSSGMKHFWWGFLIKPTRLVKYLSLFFLAIGFYELAILGISFFNHLEQSSSFSRTIWEALAATFSQSPHSVVIACVSLILGLQTLFFGMLLQILKLQQEETLRHHLAIWRELKQFNQKVN